ncbi:VG15 protein [Corynebacterium glyciniphilum]|uniref:VG15 protein n=1 Tax=Corynebacterium glyciniphilum TaxID=1404244 RepID=UPI003FD0A038
MNEIEKALRMLSKANARTFMRLWASVPSGDRQQMIEYLTPLVQDLVAGGSEQAAALALEQLNMQRSGVALPTVLADPSDPEAVAESLRFLLTSRGIDVVRDEVWGMIDRHVLNGHRQTMMLSAMAAGNGYARKLEPGACSFCMRLASRGAVYASRAHAMSVGAPGVVLRGNKKQGDRYHDGCRCAAVEVSEGDGLPPEALELRKIWEKTFYDGGKPVLPAIDFESTNEKWKEAVKDFRV